MSRRFLQYTCQGAFGAPLHLLGAGGESPVGLADVVALALAIGADCFSVCLGLAMDPGGPRRTVLVSAVFGGMQAALVGLGHLAAVGLHWLLDAAGLAGALLSHLPFLGRPAVVHQEVHWVLSGLGATVLVAVGIGLITDGSGGRRRDEIRLFRGRMGLALVGLMVNIDAFSTGLGLGLLDRGLLPHVLGVTALVGGGLCQLGFEAGSKFGERLGRIAQPVGGAVIILVALKTLAALAGAGRR
ncbi:MAG: hypothetical protein CW345_08875 [Firmicutes bacterium]|nr:hypothetical protein [Bacillota bacterium]